MSPVHPLAQIRDGFCEVVRPSVEQFLARAISPTDRHRLHHMPARRAYIVGVVADHHGSPRVPARHRECGRDQVGLVARAVFELGAMERVEESRQSEMGDHASSYGCGLCRHDLQRVARATPLGKSYFDARKESIFEDTDLVEACSI